jgi:hypothetical protein
MSGRMIKIEGPEVGTLQGALAGDPAAKLIKNVMLESDVVEVIAALYRIGGENQKKVAVAIVQYLSEQPVVLQPGQVSELKDFFSKLAAGQVEGSSARVRYQQLERGLSTKMDAAQFEDMRAALNIPGNSRALNLWGRLAAEAPMKIRHQ